MCFTSFQPFTRNVSHNPHNDAHRERQRRRLIKIITTYTSEKHLMPANEEKNTLNKAREQLFASNEYKHGKYREINKGKFAWCEHTVPC